MSETDRRMKSCDQCKARKVRCRGAGHRGTTSCISCARRNEKCHFSPLRKPRRGLATPVTASPTVSEDRLGECHEMAQYDGLQVFYLDQLLASPRSGSSRKIPGESLQALSVFGGGYSLTFFSEARLTSLEQRLGHDSVSRMSAQISTVIAQRMLSVDGVPAPATDSDRLSVFGIEKSFIASCTEAYFENVHPIHPFLDKRQIELIALGPELEHKLASDKAWSVLFYAILALGSQYHDGGSFHPAKNVAWRFFFTALALFPDLLITKATLTVVQAITAMAIFASNVSCMQFEYAMVSEGVKKATILGYNQSSASGDDPRNRTFWVLFCLEKTMTFTMVKSSSIMDSDISSALPKRSDGDEGVGQAGFDSFLAFIRLARLFSRIYAALHSASVRDRSVHYFKTTIDHLKKELEQWRTTIALPFQPAMPIRSYEIQTPQMMSICIRLHYGYHNAMLHLNRAALQLQHPDNNAEEVLSDIMHSARCVMELTKYVEVQPYTPLWILAAVPLAAFFVLFELVVDHPTHPDTSLNLALLDVGSGHASLIEYASKGVLPGSILAGFPHIARSYVREKTQQVQISRTIPAASTAPDPPSVLSSEGTNAGEFTGGAMGTSEAQLGPPLPPPPPNWDVQGDGNNLVGTDILDLFGSQFLGWDGEWLFNNAEVNSAATFTRE